MAQSQSKPLSPHLQVYRLPLTALLSVAHRLSGLALVLGMVLLVAVLFAAGAGPDSYAAVHAFADSWVGRALLIAFTFGLYLHLCNGVRHLFWDAGYGFELDTASRTAYASIITALVLTAATWLVAL